MVHVFEQALSVARAHPWIAVVFAIGLAAWIAALVAVVRSPKFLRKWAWLLCTLLTFNAAFPVADAQVSISIPVGAVYVLWFWRFGPTPSPDRVAQRAVQIQPPTQGAGARLLVLRLAYAACALAAIVMTTTTGPVIDLMTTATGGASSPVRLDPTGPMLAYGALAAVFAFLAARPYWWGKALTLWAGTAWTGFALLGLFAFFGMNPALFPVFGAGLTMLGAFAAHQIVDPRLGGSYLRAAGPAP